VSLSGSSFFRVALAGAKRRLVVLKDFYFTRTHDGYSRAFQLLLRPIKITMPIDRFVDNDAGVAGDGATLEELPLPI